jgi:nanoRNase/pAp phosphatase (c-di-AMP/oligoRNAs hydrolase)
MTAVRGQLAIRGVFRHPLPVTRSARLPENRQALELLTFLTRHRSRLSPLLILTHDFPDPDALASAWGLQHLAQAFGVESRIVHGGLISRAENRAMVRRLKIPIHRLRSGEISRHRTVALVDTQPAFQNNPFPARRRPAIVIDQHEPIEPVSADLALVDTGCGATCVILAQALLLQSPEVPASLATALAYGILSDTLDLYRVDREDVIQTYLRVLRRSDMRALAEIQNAQRSRRFFTGLAHGLRTAAAYRRVIVAHIGPVSSPEDVAHVADFLVTYDRADWSFCTGRGKGSLFVSLRTELSGRDAADVLRDIVDHPADAGGHGGVAGGRIPVAHGAATAEWRDRERSLQKRLAARLGLPSSGGFRRLFV